jgi:CRP-like cAMP-binding protein
LGPGRAFGEMSVIDAEPRSATLVAREPGLLMVLTGESFASLSDEHPRVALNLLQRMARSLSQRLRQTSGQLADYLQGF